MPHKSPSTSRYNTIKWKRLIDFRMQLNRIYKRFINKKVNNKFMNLNASHINVISINGPQQLINDISNQWWCNKRCNKIETRKMQIKEFISKEENASNISLKISRTFLLVKLSLQIFFPSTSSTIDIAKLIN